MGTLAYNVGTVAVTNGSATVTGTLTGWTSQVQVGDMFTLDGTRVVEVLTVDSNTQLTLRRNWAGTTASGQSYWIMRTSPLWSDTSRAAVKLADFLDTLNALPVGSDGAITGGIGATSTLILKSTGGVGTTDAVIVQVGNNGATEAARFTHAGDLGIGTATPGQKVEIYKASAPAIRLRNSATYWDIGLSDNNVSIGLAGGQLIAIDTGGNIGLDGQTTPLAPLHVGSTNGNNPPTASPAILVAKNRNGSGSGHGFADESWVNTTVNATGYAAFAASVNYNGTRHYDHYVAFQADLKYGSAGTMTSAIGLSVGLHFTAGLATNFYGSYIYNPPVSGTGAIANAYGHYIEDLTAGGTVNYAIYTAGTTKSYFGGAVGFGADTISATFTPQVQIKKVATDASNPAMSLILNRQNSNTACFLFGVDASNNASISINGAGDFRIGVNASGNTTFTENVRITSEANVKIGGTAQRATTEGTKQLVLFNGTAPAGTLTNGVSLYSTSGELRVMDAAGNATLLSPHDHETNEWIYHSIDTANGRGLRIDMERMMRALNTHMGWNFVTDFAA